VVLGKAEVGQEIGLGVEQEPRDGWEARLEGVDDLTNCS
jgi:hypothetical protein